MIDIEIIISIAKEAGEKILEIYKKDFSVDFKEDKSPLTEADEASNKIIIEGLKKAFPNIPIISEENKQIPFTERKDWKKFFLVDPLDGTKEFVKRNDEFTVNIALIENNTPILGVVYAPVLNILYYSDGTSSYKRENGENKKLPLDSSPHFPLRVVASKSHFNNETKEFIEKLSENYDLVNKGSSLKLCVVAEGSADIYPRLGLTSEWDTAAAHSILLGAGKNLLNIETNKELIYNKENLLNPFFMAK